jgi:hypothetical protein
MMRARCCRSESPRSAAVPLDHYAFPTIGIPPHRQVAPEIEGSIIYSVARTESAFDQRDKSVGQCGRPDAGDAGSRPRYRQTFQGQL